MKPYRLYLYNKHIVSFDSLDRKLIGFEKNQLKKVGIQVNINKHTNIIQKLTQYITLEVLGQQRFLMKNTFKKENLKVSFCKDKLLILADIYLLFFFFEKNFCLTYITLLKKIHFFIQIQTINNLNLANSNRNFIQINPNYKNKLNNFY